MRVTKLSLMSLILNSRDSLVAQMVRNQPAGQKTWSRQEDPSREWLPTPVFLPGELNGQSSLVGYSPWSCEKLDKTERLSLSLLIDILSVCLEGSVSLRSLEINKLINKPCPHCRSDGRKNINHQWGRYNKPTGFYTGNFDCSK